MPALVESVTVTAPPVPLLAAPAPRGECPSAHQPFHQLDGALLRVRVPGGILTARQFGQVAAAASRYGTTVELTSRANLQIRGVSLPGHGDLIEQLVAAGVVLADAAADGRRNVLASPTAGCDRAEVVDTRPLVAELASLLAVTSGLSPKFGLLVDSGGSINIRGRAHDLSLGAVSLPVAGWGYEIRLAEALPVEAGDPSVIVAPGEALALVAAAIGLVAEEAPGGRMGDLVSSTGRAAVLEETARRSGIRPRAVTVAGVPPSSLVAPVGVLAQRQAGLVMVGAMPVLGRIDPPVLEAVATLAAAGEVRLTPWRSLLLTDVPAGESARVVARLRGLGLAVDPGDPALRVVACAGSTGCSSALADTQREGRDLVAALRTAPPATPVSFHLSGCPKMCADRTGRYDHVVVGGEPA